MTFLGFVEDTLGLHLTPAWRVLIRVAIDGEQPRDLEGAERELARELFGDVDHVSALARRMLVWILGRESWKTTIAASLALYVMLTADLSAAGPGDVPTFMVVAPDKKTAALAVRIALDLARENEEIKPFVEGDTAEGFQIRRPDDGRLVAFECFAVSRAGANLRGRSILGAILDESMFFTSDAEGDYVKNDRDVYRAIVPRLMKGGRVIFISTPWPTETFTGELFAANYGHPMNATVAKAPTLVMRDNDPEVAERIEAERAVDADNTARERDCDMTMATGAGLFFDGNAIDNATDAELPIEVGPVKGIRFCAAMDLAFRSDAAACAIIGRDGEEFALFHALEIRPEKGVPLKPSEVLAQFAAMMKRYGVRSAYADQHQIDACRELIADHDIALLDAPGGAPGKLETHLRAKTIVHEGRFTMPRNSRVVAQLKAVRSKPAPGGGLSIWSPRRKGSHGDLASAVVLGLWAANEIRGGDGPYAEAAGAMNGPLDVYSGASRFDADRGY